MAQYSFLAMKERSTPKGFADYVAAGGDLYYWETGGFWVVTKTELAKQVLTGAEFSADRSKFFISRMPDMDLSLIKDFFAIVSRMMVMSDAKEHRARRRVAQSAFTDKLIRSYQQIVDQAVTKLLDTYVVEGRVDFAEHIAKNLPSMVLADLFQIPDVDRPDFFYWSNNMTAFFGGASAYQNEDGREVNKSALCLYRYFAGLLKQRRAEPQQDFFSMMLQFQGEISDAELISQAIMMLVAGQVTTTDQLCNNMYTLMEQGAFATLRQHPELLDHALEECNRLDPAVTFLFRVTNAPVILNGIAIPAGQTIFIANHVVNRDPAVFKQPDDFLIDRANRQHFAYGYGPHYCLGARLARVQMHSLFSQLMARYPRIELDPSLPVERWHYSLAFSGFRRLPLRLQEEKKHAVA